MNEWKEYKLGDVCIRLSSGKSISLQDTAPNGDFPIFGGNGIRGYSHKSNFEGECTIIGRQGAYCGNVRYFKGKAYMTEHAVVMIANVENNTRFLSYFLSLQNLGSLSAQSAQPGISVKTLSEQKYLLPPIEEQERIARILSSLDDKIDLLNRQNATLEAMAETLFRQYFIESPKDEWKDGYLDDILTVKGGTTPSTSNPNFWDGDIAWTSPRDITTLNGIYLFETGRKITQEGLLQIGSGLLSKGTLLMSSRAPVGVLAFTEIPLAINQGYIAMLDNRGFSKEFIYLWLKANMDLVHSYSNGSTFMEISKSAFKSLEISLPPIKLLTEFQELILPLFDKIKANAIQIRSLTKLRDTLLPKLMNNEIKICQ